MITKPNKKQVLGRILAKPYDRRADSEWFAANRDELSLEYGGKFVAIRDKEVLAAGPDRDSIVGSLLMIVGYRCQEFIVRRCKRCPAALRNENSMEDTAKTRRRRRGKPYDWKADEAWFNKNLNKLVKKYDVAEYCAKALAIRNKRVLGVFQWPYHVELGRYITRKFGYAPGEFLVKICKPEEKLVIYETYEDWPSEMKKWLRNPCGSPRGTKPE